MRKRDPLYGSFPLIPYARVRCVAIRVRERIFLCSQCHDTLRTQADIDNPGPSHNIDGFVRVLRDVVSTAAIVLDQNMIDGFVQDIFYVLADLLNCR